MPVAGVLNIKVITKQNLPFIHLLPIQKLRPKANTFSLPKTFDWHKLCPSNLTDRWSVDQDLIMMKGHLSSR